MMFLRKKAEMVSADAALPGRDMAIPTASTHFVNGQPLKGPYPEGLQQVQFGLGCFWGAERKFWELDGVHVTAVGYAGGVTPNATYEEVCSGQTNHTEVVLVVFDPAKVSFETLLKTFWEAHDPTQGMRQGNDVGTQYRSAIYPANEEQMTAAKKFLEQQQKDGKWSKKTITTELKMADEFHRAEEYHQDYHAKHGGSCPIPD